MLIGLFVSIIAQAGKPVDITEPELDITPAILKTKINEAAKLLFSTTPGIKASSQKGFPLYQIKEFSLEIKPDNRIFHAPIGAHHFDITGDSSPTTSHIKAINFMLMSDGIQDHALAIDDYTIASMILFTAALNIPIDQSRTTINRLIMKALATPDSPAFEIIGDKQAGALAKDGKLLLRIEPAR